MKHRAVTFRNVQTGKKNYREYPKTGSLRTRKGLCKMLQNRDWKVLKQGEGWIADKIEEYDPINAKLALADKLGKLIYNRK